MASPATLESFLASSELSLEEFLREHSEPVLVLEARSEGQRVETTGFTIPISGSVPEANVSGLQVLKLCKRTKGLANLILIGRSSKNDVMIKATEVSKHHASATVEPNGVVSLIDLGSTNGTFVRGRQLVAHKERARLEAGDRIGFGSVEGTFHQPRTFYRFLRRAGAGK